MEKRIKEQDLKRILKTFQYKKIKIKISGSIKQEVVLENAEIVFLNNDIELNIKDVKDSIILNLSYIEEIVFIEKNKLKFLTNTDLEILIIFL